MLLRNFVSGPAWHLANNGNGNKLINVVEICAICGFQCYVYIYIYIYVYI